MFMYLPSIYAHSDLKKEPCFYCNTVFFSKTMESDIFIKSNGISWNCTKIIEFHSKNSNFRVQIINNILLNRFYILKNGISQNWY